MNTIILHLKLEVTVDRLCETMKREGWRVKEEDFITPGQPLVKFFGVILVVAVLVLTN